MLSEKLAAALEALSCDFDRRQGGRTRGALFWTRPVNRKACAAESLLRP